MDDDPAVQHESPRSKYRTPRGRTEPQQRQTQGKQGQPSRAPGEESSCPSHHFRSEISLRETADSLPVHFSPLVEKLLYSSPFFFLGARGFFSPPTKRLVSAFQRFPAASCF